MSTTNTIVEAGQLMRAGHTSPLELVESCLQRIEQLDPQIHAWASVDATGARLAAVGLSQELAANRVRGPLHGIPLGIKDIISVQGMPTRAGSTVTNPAPAETDATVVAALREAGAIILGKTVTTEFACFDPSPTRNPWNLEHTPGGSSSGSAAAVATGMCLGALGSQTGGSITRPASFCGVAGLKPTHGKIGMSGIVPVSVHLDHVGPMARSAADLAFLFQAMGGDKFEESEPQPPRLGLVESYFMETAAEPITTATRKAIETLKAAGATIHSPTLPSDFEIFISMHRRLMAFDAAAFHQEWFGAHRSQYGPNVASLLDEGQAITHAQYLEALTHQHQFRRQMESLVSEAGILVTPATVTTAPSLESTGDPGFNSPWSYTGLPTISVPCGLASDGLPASLQLIGPPESETTLLKAAQWCESRLAFDKTPPL